MNRLAAPALGCLTLGLAPFVPEPHVVGKLRWVLGGAVGMSGLDWFDLAFHGLPWLWLAVATVQHVRGHAAGAGRRRSAAVALAVAGAVLCTLWATLQG